VEGEAPPRGGAGGGGALEARDAIEPSGLFEPKELLFPWGARGVPMPGSLLTDLDRLVWAPCPGRQAPPLGWDTPQMTVDAAMGYLGRGGLPRSDGRRRDDQAGRHPTLFESALVTLMSRPFGWLVVAEPSELIDTEIAELRTQLNVLRRYDEEHSRFDASRAERRLAELDAFREAGLWNVRVLAGAAWLRTRTGCAAPRSPGTWPTRSRPSLPTRWTARRCRSPPPRVPWPP